MEFQRALLLLIAVFVGVCTHNDVAFASAHSQHRNRPNRRFRGGRVKRPEYYGSGCPPSSLMLVNSSDETSFAMSVLFSGFQAQTSATVLRDKKKCFVNVELTVEPGMSIGIVHIDFRGYAHVPEASPDSFAQLSASYRMVRGVRGMIAERNFSSGFSDDIYEGMDFDPIVWTPCRRNHNHNKNINSSSSSNPSALADNADADADTYWIRIESKIVAQKARCEDDDVQISIDSSDAMLEKGLLKYEMISRPCE